MMRRIGILGGMSWESTALYYRLTNQAVRERLGGLHSANIVMRSVDFAEISKLQHGNDWAGAEMLLAQAAVELRQGGADFLVLATNTMHRVADGIRTRSGLELLHIADPTGAAIRAAGYREVLLLGTRFTMEQDFFRERLTRGFGLDVRIPVEIDRREIHRIIYDELCLGRIEESSRRTLEDVIARAADAGARAVILGCTELTLLGDPGRCVLPLFDTTALHARAAVDRALADTAPQPAFATTSTAPVAALRQRATIRPSTPDDMGLILQLHRSAFRSEQEAEAARAILSGEHCAVSLLAELDGRIVGHVSAARLSGPLPALILGPLSVAADCREMQIGTALVREAMRLARESGAEALFAEGGDAFFERFGFSAALAQPFRIDRGTVITTPVAPGRNGLKAVELREGALEGQSGFLADPARFRGSDY